MGKLLYTTREIFSEYLKASYRYKIPAYQRGYKWEDSDVTSLLNDISAFVPNDEVNSFYCLQNITLVEKEEDKVYHVVDGQQRLTTLIIILSYLKETLLVKDKVLYAVREQTHSFINDYLLSGKIDEFNDWEELLTKNQECDYQDIYYIFQAYKAVKLWFDKNNSLYDIMKMKILDNVQVIVNLPKNVDEQELFENLNGKRVSLDGADLIRALIITRVAKTEIGDLDDEVKKNVLMNERRIRIGLSLDTINLWWSDENRQAYFSNFTQNAKIVDNSNVDFNEKYPINNLYKLYVLAYGNGMLSLGYFEEKSTEDGFLEKLLNLQRIIENWYNDNILYHLILFTSIYASQKYDEDSVFSFKYLVETWSKHSKRTFINYLKNRIKKSNAIKELVDECDSMENIIDEEKSQNEKSAFEEYYYDSKLTEISVLLDIISNLSSTTIEKRLPANYFFKRKKEDWEHIFPQTPIGDRIKDKNKQTEILLQYVETINRIVPDTEKINVKEDEINWDDVVWKNSTKEYINNILKKIIPINSLGNMCLLHENVNRGYGNDFFSEKRIDVMVKSQQGYFIRPHVFDAFNKIFLKREQESIGIEKMTSWTKEDILERRKYIINTITDFLTTEHE